jgi:hypothetical protein
MRDSTYRRRARELRSSGLLRLDLRKSFSASQKGWITRKYAELERFKSAQSSLIAIPKGKSAGDRKKLKPGLIAVPTRGADAVRYSRGEIVHEWKRDGKVYRRTREPLDLKPANLEKAFNKYQKKKPPKGTRRFFAVRRADAVGRGQTGIVFDGEDGLNAYTKSFEPLFVDRETRRLKRQGMSARDAKRRAKENVQAVIESWYLVEFIEDDEEDE